MKYEIHLAVDHHRLFEMNTRGIGYESGNVCFCCGRNAINNISAFVPTRETGDVIVSLFEKGARLDYRWYEPEWIQVKIYACDQHKHNLEALDDDIRNCNGVSIAIITEATKTC